MNTVYVIQPQGNNPRPYPFFVHPDGTIGRQDFWRGSPFRLEGFQADIRVNTVALFLGEFYANPDRAIGLYPVFSNAGGDMWTLTNPISEVRKETVYRDARTPDTLEVDR